MGSIEPGVAATTAETGDTKAGGGTAMGSGEGDSAVKVLKQAGVGCFADHLADDLADIGHFRKITEACIEFRRDGGVACLGEAAAGVLDVVMDAEDLLDHHHDGEWPRTGGLCEIPGQVGIANRDPDFASLDPGGVGGDHLGLDPGRRERQPGYQPGHHQAAAGERVVLEAGEAVQVVHAGGSLLEHGHDVGERRRL